MKKIITLILVAFTLTNIKAQITFPAKGADWHYMVSNGGFTGPTYYTNTEIKYTYDTLINGRTAAVINNSWLFTNYDFPGTSYFYTSHDSVFCYNANTLNHWQLLYSFNTPVGQTWQFNIKSVNSTTTNHWIFYVDSIKKTFVSGDSLKTLYVTRTLNGATPIYFPKSVIIDRIGELNYFLNVYDAGIESVCDGCNHMNGLLCYQDSTLSLYQPNISKDCNYTTVGIKQIENNSQIFVYPNPAKDKIYVNANEVAEIKITDVLGKELLSTKDKEIDIRNLQTGIYFINTKTNQETYITKFIKE